MTLSANALRGEYPALNPSPEQGAPPIYFDNAATVLKPRSVIDTVHRYLSRNGANVHRGIHYLSLEASEEFEAARDVVAAFIGADQDEIVFVRNTTEAINLVAHSLPPGQRVLVTGMEHHSNLLPWRERHEVRAVPLLEDGSLDKSAMKEEIRRGADLVAICHISNVFGSVNPIEEIVELSAGTGTKVLVDGAQAAPHLPVDVKRLGCDFYAFSGHKLGSPTGIGVLYGTRESLSKLTPLNWGGNMITAVHVDGHSIHEPPLRFEAGTPAIEATLGLAAACEFLEDVGLDQIWAHDIELGQYARDVLGSIDRVRLHGPRLTSGRSGIVNFTIDGIPSNMVAKVLSDRARVCVRSGYLCAQPLHELMSLEPSTRASFYLYNTVEEIDVMATIVAELVATG